MHSTRRKWLLQGSLATLALVAGKRLPAHPTLDIYTGLPPGPINLNANENPYGPSAAAKKAMAETVNSSNRYPWDATTALREAIGKHHGLDSAHVLLGAGSSEILGLTAQYAAREKGNAIAADPTFGSWFMAAKRLGLNVELVPLTQRKQYDLAAMLGRINSETRLLYICNPNNPTGTVVERSTLKTVITTASKTTLVLLDEAYTEYSNETSMAEMVTDNRNLVIAKTFSKIYGMAGARCGYALAHPDTIDQLGARQPWANAGVSAVSLAGAIASLGDEGFVKTCKQQNSTVRNFTAEALVKMGLHVIESHTNFLYFSLQNYTKDYAALLDKAQINGTGIREESGKWTRITIGTMEEMQQFISTLSI